VTAVVSEGNTNMGAGIELARDLLLKHAVKGNLQRIYLFSDGLVNEGIKTHQGIFDLIAKVRETGIGTTSFGIGEDFDEDLMKGIAEYGSSFYFYIENSEKIPKWVGAALGGMIGIIGKEAVLKIRGKNGAVVKRVYGTGDILKGVKIGDIKQSNIKNTLVQLEYTPDAKKDTEEVLSYELQYIRSKGDEPQQISGTISIQLTEDDKHLNKQNAETVVALTIQQSADCDLEMEKLLNEGKTKEAIKVKEDEIEMLKKVLSLDATGRIEAVLAKAEKSLTELKEQGNTKHMRKQVKYHRNIKMDDQLDQLCLT